MDILVCYDESDFAKKALTTGMEMGKAFGAELHIFTALSPKENSKQVFEFIQNDADIEIANAKKNMEKACQIVEQAGMTCHTHISSQGKSVGEEIIEFAEQIKADYIVIGVHKRSRVGKLLFGSTAQYVILNGTCPVVAVS